MNGEENYEVANDQKYEKQVKEALRQVYLLTEVLQKNEKDIMPEHYNFYYYFSLKEKLELLEALKLNGLWDKTEKEFAMQQKELQKEIEKMVESQEGIEEKYQIATKRIGSPGDPYGVREIAKRVQFEIKSKRKEGPEKEIGEETARE